jgi:hypothetical protein
MYRTPGVQKHAQPQHCPAKLLHKTLLTLLLHAAALLTMLQLL